MNYGLYLSAAGVLTNTYRQDVCANNLANVETVGFKRDLAMLQPRLPETKEDGFGGELSHDLLDKLGGGVFAGPQRICFNTAPLKATGEPLDAALETPDAFFAVRTADGQVRLTRDGRFSRDSGGYLVTASGGLRVLDPQDNPIPLPDRGEVVIDNAGRLLGEGEELGQLQIASVHDLDRLRKEGQNLLSWSGDDPRKPAAEPSVKQGFVESSGVDPIKALMDLVDATKSAGYSGTLIRYQDQMLDRAANTLGRVA